MYDFDRAERERIISEARRLRDLPIPRSYKSLGCPFLILVPPVLILATQLLPDRLTGVSLGAAGLMVLAGLYFFFFGATRQLSTLMERATSSVELLATRFNELSADERRSAAVRALYYAHFSDGPTTFPVYDSRVDARMGDALPYIIAVERVLLAENLIYPVFTNPNAES